MRYTGNYRLMDNPRAKHSHQLRAILKKRDRFILDQLQRGGACHCGYACACTPELERAFNELEKEHTEGGAK